VKVSPRESVLLLVTTAIILFGGSIMMARTKIERWQELRKEQSDIVSEIEGYRELVADREKWEQEMAEVSKTLPVLPANQEVDVYWLSMMDKLAAKHGVTIRRRQAGEERQERAIYELPIECREWEADLDSLVHFLFDLQEEGVMLDVRQLSVRPKGKTGLKGRFSLSCVYTRQEE
jgi:Tfp pilus assembly protein PilO